MQKLMKKQLVNCLDYNTSKEVEVCEACIGGKQCKNSFKPSKMETSMPFSHIHTFLLNFR